MSRPKVLYVDDSELLRRSASRMLRLSGFDVIVVDGADAAIAMVRSQQFDAALVDLEMPGANGWETIDRIAVIDPDLAAHAILFTASAFEEEVIARAARSRIALLSKTSECVDIIATIRDRIARRAPMESSVFSTQPMTGRTRAANR